MFVNIEGHHRIAAERLNLLTVVANLCMRTVTLALFGEFLLQ